VTEAQDWFVEHQGLRVPIAQGATALDGGPDPIGLASDVGGCAYRLRGAHVEALRAFYADWAAGNGFAVEFKGPTEKFVREADNLELSVTVQVESAETTLVFLSWGRGLP
jgi:hypothetical protein